MNDSGGVALILELADRLLRSWWTVVAGLCLGLAGGVMALDYLPKTYDATTKILVSPPAISQDFVKSTAGDDMAFRFAALKEAVLSRPYMLTLIEKTYGPQRSPADTERLILQIRSKVDVKVERYGGSGGAGDRAGMFSLEFKDSDAKRAAQVVNDWADLYIRENSKHRTSRAEETTSTLEDLASDVRAQLATKEKAITEFRSQHLYELPERVEANLALLASRQRDLEANQRTIQSAQDRLQLLQAQAAAAEGASSSVPEANLDPNGARLAQLRRELAILKARYLDDHPEVKGKEREINDLIATMKIKPPGQDAVTERVATPLSPRQQEIQNQTKEVARLQEDQKRIRRDIDTYNARIEAAPQVQLQLEERSKGYDVLQQQYKDYQSKAQSAKGAQTIESAQKGERFEVIERAVPPVIPIEPKPTVIIAMGVALGLFVFVGPVLMIGFVRPTVQSEERLRGSVPVPVLVSIPRIETESTKRLVARVRTNNFVLSALSVVVLVVVCVFNYAR
jgi:polysaccharide chain length determinant protein (PEP-CTERM system associated)